MKAVMIVFKKEIYRVFSDKKMIFSLFILPAIIVIGIYGLMGVLVANMMQDQEEHVAIVSMYNAPDSFKDYIKANNIVDNYNIRYEYSLDGAMDEVDTLKQDKDLIYSGDMDLIIVFPTDFQDMIDSYKSGSHSIPNVLTYYNPSEDYSSNAQADLVNGVLEDYRQATLIDRVKDENYLTVFTVDKDNDENVIQNNDKAKGKILGMIVPYLITILLFSSAMSLGIDTIAGEKERGTLTAMLMAPINRSSIVYGKLLALMVLSGLSAIIYGGSASLTLPFTQSISGGSSSGIMPSMTLPQVIMLLIIIVSMVFVYVAIIALPSVFAKNSKEGSALVMPFYMVVMISGMITMFAGDDPNMFEFLIPIYGSAIALKNIFTTEINLLQFALALLSNLVTGGILAFIVTKLFNNEKIMYNA